MTDVLYTMGETIIIVVVWFVLHPWTFAVPLSVAIGWVLNDIWRAADAAQESSSGVGSQDG